MKEYKPKMINDLTVQHHLWDRTKVLDTLKRIEVPVAKSIVVYRNGGKHELTQEEIEKQVNETKDVGVFYVK